MSKRGLTRPTRRISDDMYERLHPSFFPSNTDRAADFTLIPTARLFFRDVIEQISKAQHSVDLQFYTLEADREVMRVLSACQAAAERGVVMRILVDHLASDPRRLLATRRTRKHLNRSANIEIRQSYTRESPARFTTRDHKKIVVIDNGKHAYIGGINLARRSLRWNDFMIRISGSTAKLIATDFDMSWNGTNKSVQQVSDPDAPNTILLTDSGERETIIQFALELIKNASKRVWLETPYLDMTTIGKVLVQAKKHAPELDIQIIVPRFNNYPIDRLRTKRVCNRLREMGIPTHQYGKTYHRLNHTKMLIIDDVAIVGSSNFNTSIFAGQNAEIAVATRNKNLVEQLERWYCDDLSESIL